MRLREKVSMSEQRVRPPTAEETAEINGNRDRGLARLDAGNDASPADVARAADALVDQEQIQRQKLLKGLFLLMFRDPESIIGEIGAAWGEQLVRAFGWRWQYAIREKEFERAVTSPDQALVVFPNNYLGRMLRPPYDDVTLMLMFNMIQAKKLPAASAGAMEDISDGRLRHIVPKR
jgi:hypothetical protein